MARFIGLLAVVTWLVGPAAAHSPAPPRAAHAAPAAAVQPLHRGCNQVVSGFPDGTSAVTIAAAIQPGEAFRSLWRLDVAAGRFAGYARGGEAASDLRAVNRLDALWLCVSADAELQMPDIAADAPVLRCTARAVPIGRPETLFDVACNLSGAASTDTSFSVMALSPNGTTICSGALAAGTGACSGRLAQALDPDVLGPPLSFFAVTVPSGTIAADTAPTLIGR